MDNLQNAIELYREEAEKEKEEQDENGNSNSDKYYLDK